MYCDGFSSYKICSTKELNDMPTRQLLKLLRSTYRWGCPYCWKDEDWAQLKNYRLKIKSVLATREHIPNKQESKAIRKAKIKKGK